MATALQLVILAGTLGFGSVADADPDGRSCKNLKPVGFAALSTRARARMTSGEQWERSPAAKWKVFVVSVSIERAPHLAKAILEDCPGVTVTSTYPAHQRWFSSYAEVHLTSFAALSRLAQLPAITSISVRDPTIRPPHRHPIHEEFFE